MRLTCSLADQNFATTKSVGILNVSLGLVEHLRAHPALEHLTLLGNRTLPPLLPPAHPGAFIGHDEAIGGRWQRILWDQFGVYRAARRAGNPWLLLPKGFASFSRRCPVKLAAYVHDVMFDHYGRNHPGAFPFLEQAYFRRCFRATLRQASVLFTNTAFTAAEVRRVAAHEGWPVPPIHVAGIGSGLASDPVSSREDSILVLAGRLPHKRTDLAIAHLSRWQTEAAFKGTLEWVGGLPAGLSLPSRPGWTLHPRLPEDQYRALLRRCRVVVYVSEYEGFGMPPLEAVLAGAVPVFSRLPATTEVMGDCGCPFTNEQYEEFASAMRKALRTPLADVVSWGAQLRLRHDWSQVATRVMNALAAT